MKKFSWLLILSLLVTTLTVPVFNKDAKAVAGDLFDATETFYAPDFSKLTDMTDGGQLIPINVSNPLTIASDGSLQLNAASPAAQATLRILFTANGANLPTAGVYCVDFDIKKPNSSAAAYIGLFDKDGYQITHGGGDFYTYIHQDPKFSYTDFTNVKFLVEFGGKNRIMTLVDNTLYSTKTRTRPLARMQITANASSSNNYYLKNLSVYKVNPTDFDSADKFFSMDESTILGENASADAITTNLNLDDSLTWTSSNEKIISNDGVVSRDMVWPSTTVTLTAKAGNKLSKAFTFSVLRGDLPTTEGMTGDYYVYDDFETSTQETGGLVPITGNAQIKDGKLYHTHTGSSGEQTFRYFFTSLKAGNSTIAAQGNIYAIEFDVKKELVDEDDTSAYYIRILTYDGYRYYAQNNIRGSYSQASGTSGKAYDDASINHFKYIIDTANNTYSLYINGMLEFYEAPRNTDGNPYAHVQGIQLTNQTPGATISMDNIKVYRLSNKTYKTGYVNYGITRLGELVDVVDAAGAYDAHISYLATGLAEAPAEDSLPVCYFAKYNGDMLESVAICPAKLVTYSETDGVYGWWFPIVGGKIRVTGDEVGDTSIKAFVWDGTTPVDKHIAAKAVNKN